jgi:hypothetical protein
VRVFGRIGIERGYTRVVEETANAELIDTQASQHLLQQSLGSAALGSGTAGNHVVNRSIYNMKNTLQQESTG